jgi:hypothetical protein
MLSFSLSFALIAVLRLLAIHFDWQIPAWRPD